MSRDEEDRFLDKISSSFCLSKWLHLSLHLDRGTGHSCYHVPEESIDVENLLENPSLMHNTETKRWERRMMLSGERPKGCQYCWRQEDLPSSQQSDRYVQSSSAWAKPLFEVIAKSPDKDVLPAYLEVSFENTCQLKCAYCGPHNSTAWQVEIEKFGNYTDRKFPMSPKGFNSTQYHKAFWQWWPELSKSLNVFRLTGGEPLLSKETWHLIDYFLENPSPQINLVINSNLSLENSLISALCAKVEILIERRSINSFKVITSLEAIGPAAEYIRHGINLQRFWSNIRLLLTRLPNIEVSITSTIQALSVDSFIQFVEFFIEFRTENGFSKLSFDPTAIIYPDFMRIENLPNDDKSRFVDGLSRLIDRREAQLTFFEIKKIKDLISVLELKVSEPEMQRSRIRLFYYFDSYDKIRNLNFVNTFPGLEKYWRQAAEKARYV